MPSGTLWSISSDTHQVVDIWKKTSAKMYKKLFWTFSWGFENLRSFLCVFEENARLTSNYILNFTKRMLVNLWHHIQKKKYIYRLFKCFKVLCHTLTYRMHIFIAYTVKYMTLGDNVCVSTSNGIVSLHRKLKTACSNDIGQTTPMSQFVL